PGWEEGLLPHQRSLDEEGRAGLEEERRLAHVGMNRARKRAKIYFVSNRRMRGSWSSTIPSRFVDELPEPHVEVAEATGFGGFAGYGNVGGSRFDQTETFGSSYGTPGWQRARSRGGGNFGARGPFGSVGRGGGNVGAGGDFGSGGQGGGFRDAGPSYAAKPAAAAGGAPRRAPITIEG